MAAVVTFAVMIIAGHTVSAQLIIEPPPSLKTVPIPGPENLSDFIKDKTAAIALGKSFFWDMQVGSDGITACASCHFHAGADNRSKNQLSPGLNRVNLDRSSNPDRRVDLGGLNYTLRPEDYPFHKLANPDDRSSTVLASTNDVTSSQGIFKTKFVDVTPGSAEEKVILEADPNFNISGTNIRQVQPRNTPTVINSVFNFRNVWDARPQNVFNGVNPFGLRDSNAKVLKAANSDKLEEVKVSLKNSSLASQALGPPLTDLEMSASGRVFEDIGQKFRKGKQNKLPREMGKKFNFLRPLGKQIVHPEDSVLGPYSRAPEPGLKMSTYKRLIEDAFKPEWWNSKTIISIDADGKRAFASKNPNGPLATNEYTLMEYNFPLFFGLAMQMYESTLVSDNAPFDQYQEGNNNALTAQQRKGLDIFLNKGKCITCHIGPEFTSASVSNVQNKRLTRLQTPGNPVTDTGFFNTGVSPVLEDFGLGIVDPFGNPISDAQLAQQGRFKEIYGEDPNLTIGPNDTVAVDGAFRTPGLRNVELTAPYFHNGGQLTLRQVVDFYNRGGDFADNASPKLPELKLTEEEKEALVAFLKGLTDERVRYEKAPFDHPQLFVTNGHPGDQSSVTNDGTGKATDTMIEISAIGRNGLSSPSSNFLGR